MTNAPFWKTTSLENMSEAEWESLCDGCGRCCLVKLEDADTAEIYFTSVACTLFDEKTCRCKDYTKRSETVSDCVRLTPQNLGSLNFLPPTCAYRLLSEGKDLPLWHPLRTGRQESVMEAGISVKGRIMGVEHLVPVEVLQDYIVQWPKKSGRGKGRAKK